MKLSGCEAFIFDLDGVLLDNEPLHDKCSLSVLRKVGIIAESSVLSPFRGASSRVLWQNMKSKYGLSESEDELVRMQWETIVKMVPDCGIPASRGLAELLELLKDKGIPCAIASSSAREYIEAVLKYLDVESYFSEVVDGFMVTKGKPAPDIYLLAAERLGADPAGCVVVEDSTNGVRAGKNAGMYVIGYDNPTSPGQDISPADIKVKSLFEAIDLISDGEES